MSYVKLKRRASLRDLALPVLAGAGLFGAWIWYSGCIDRELRDLPEADRQALYQRTSQTLKQTCSESSGPQMTDYCRDQAELLLHFPECDDDCRALSRRYLHVPAR